MVNIKPLKIHPCIKIFCVAKSSLIGLLFLFTMAVLVVTTTRCSGNSNGNENKDVNECLSGNGGCDVNATCTLFQDRQALLHELAPASRVTPRWIGMYSYQPER